LLLGGATVMGGGRGEGAGEGTGGGAIAPGGGVVAPGEVASGGANANALVATAGSPEVGSAARSSTMFDASYVDMGNAGERGGRG
jgi:hypothetical protein